MMLLKKVLLWSQTALEVYEGLTSLVKGDDVSEIGREDSTHWNITVTNREAAGILFNAGKIVCGNRTVNLISVSQQTLEVRVHWLPGYVKDVFLIRLF